MRFFKNSEKKKQNRETSARFFVALLDPVAIVPPSVHGRTKKYAENLFEQTAQANFLLWLFIWIVAIFLNDIGKLNFQSWFYYRLVVISTIGFLYITFLYSKSRIRIVTHVSVFLLGASMSLGYSWSHRLGSPLPREFITLLPFLVYSTCYRSLFVSVLFLFSSLLLSYSEWAQFNRVAWIFTDFEIALFGLFFANMLYRAVIENKSNHFHFLDLEKEKAENEHRFYSELLKFISPNLVSQLKRKLYSYQNLSTAVEDLLRRRKITTAVLYCDWRDFSSQSDSISFIENELIPSSAAVIDICEKNMGVSRQIGDAILSFFPLEDSEESLLLAMKSALEALRNQGKIDKDWALPKRFFIVTYGDAVIGNMASNNHRELTIIGKPANLAARIDELTKLEEIKKIVIENKGILISSEAKSKLEHFADGFKIVSIRLSDLHASLRSYPTESDIAVFPLLQENVDIINKLLLMNGHDKSGIELSEYT